MRRYCSVSVDVDPLDCYYRIHGLGTAPGALRDVILRRCLPRFAELFEERGIHATFFVVGADVDVEASGASARGSAALLERLAAAGHELANHSYDHPYDLARESSAVVREQIVRCHQLLSDIAGRPVRGFRAPGYAISRVVLEELLRAGYTYDSSLFPAPGYYIAKAAAMVAMAAQGRSSGAVLTDPRAVAGPVEPYRPSLDAPWRRGDANIIEIPIAVTPGLRLPAIGTSLLLAPRRVRRWWLRSMRRRSLFNLELHAIDLADAEEDGIPGELVLRQPDLRIPLVDKRRTLSQMLDDLIPAFEFVPLEVAAERARSIVG